MSDELLIFFAFPIATIIISAIMETYIKCPLKIAGLTFAIYLIITYSDYDSEFLVNTILYTTLSFLSAWIVKKFTERERNFQNIEELITGSNDILNNNIIVGQNSNDESSNYNYAGNNNSNNNVSNGNSCYGNRSYYRCNKGRNFF